MPVNGKIKGSPVQFSVEVAEIFTSPFRDSQVLKINLPSKVSAILQVVVIDRVARYLLVPGYDYEITGGVMTMLKYQLHPYHKLAFLKNDSLEFVIDLLEGEIDTNPRKSAETVTAVDSVTVITA